MKIQVKAYFTFNDVMGSSKQLELEFSRMTLKQLLIYLIDLFGEPFQDMIFKPEDSNVLNSMILVNGRNYRNCEDGLSTNLHDGDTVSLFPPIAGG